MSAVAAPNDISVTTAGAGAPPTTIIEASIKRWRVSRWDRPPEPHDWRWAVGHIGRALIALGLLMFGFVAYQLWGTGLQTSRAQNQLEIQYEERVASLPDSPDTIAPAPPTTAAAPTVPVTSVTGSTVVPATTLPPETTTTLSPSAVQQNYGPIGDGAGLGRITIPKIDVSFYYVAGVGGESLKKGVGHFPISVAPGQLGNAALAGHRTTYAAPFYDLDDLEEGDEIWIQTILGDAYVYKVTGSEVVDPSDFAVVTDSDPSVATLTLITCTPIGTSTRRLVVHATLDPDRSPSPVGIGQKYYGQAGPDPSLGDPGMLPSDPLGEATVSDVATTSPAALNPTATSIDVELGTIVEATTSDPTTTTAVEPTTSAVANSAALDDLEGQFADDAFQQGWFDDSAALPHVFGWAALFVLVWYSSYRLAKRFRRLWLGLLVGIAPDVVALFFFYENVNRLLPAAI